MIQNMILASGSMQLLNCSFAQNRPTFIKEITGFDGYVAITPCTTSPASLTGSITWGSSGITFTLNWVSSEIKITNNPHKNCKLNTNEREKLIELAVENAVPKLLDKITKKDAVNRDYNYKGMKLSARVHKNSDTTKNNLDLFKNQGIIDEDFVSFISKNLDQFIVSNYE